MRRGSRNLELGPAQAEAARNTLGEPKMGPNTWSLKREEGSMQMGLEGEALEAKEGFLEMT